VSKPPSPQQPAFLDTRKDPEFAKLLVPDKTIRLAVSGDVLLTKLEVRLIDTPDFQRLRRVRQLGAANLVYPTSLHTRFDHSIGTLHMAQRMLTSIQANSHSAEEERTVTSLEQILTRLYALLHDVPHIPFGHTLEDELGVMQRHDENADRLERFFSPQSAIGSIISEVIGRDNLDRLVALYNWDKTSPLPYDDAFVYDIVSNTVCADLLDYLARDNFFCNLGVSLEYRFLNFLYLHRDKKGQRRVFVRLFKSSRPVARRDTLTDLCRLLETRYLIAERVYFHHAKISGSAMLGRAFHEAMLSGEITEEQTYAHSDDSLVQALENSNATVAKALATAFSRRALHKQLHKYGVDEIAGAQSQDHSRTVVTDILQRFTKASERREFEDRVALEVGAAEGDVLLYCPPDKMNLKIAQMKVVWEGAEIELSAVSDPIIQPRLKEIVTAHQRLWGVWVFVNPRLDEATKHLIRQACDLQFVTPESERAVRTRQYYELLVDRQLQTERIAVAGTTEFYGSRSAIVADMVATAKDDRPFRERLAASIAARFAV
jgi:HD superfamily phosphohydrolase